VFSCTRYVVVLLIKHVFIISVPSVSVPEGNKKFMKSVNISIAIDLGGSPR